MNVMKLVKLIYLVDRLSLEKRGVPVVGGAYFSMKNGPVPSDLLDLVNSGSLFGDDDTQWKDHISDRAEHALQLLQKPSYDELSKSEVRLLDEIYVEHGKRNQWELVEWCHKNCAEWSPLESGRKAIHVADIGNALGMDDAVVERLSANAKELSFVHRAIDYTNAC